MKRYAFVLIPLKRSLLLSLSARYLPKIRLAYSQTLSILQVNSDDGGARVEFVSLSKWFLLLNGNDITQSFDVVKFPQAIATISAAFLYQTC